MRSLIPELYAHLLSVYFEYFEGEILVDADMHLLSQLVSRGRIHVVARLVSQLERFRHGRARVATRVVFFETLDD